MIAIEIATRVLSDPLPQGNVDGIYLFAQTEDNQTSVLESASALYHMRVAGKILIINTPPMNGFAGFEEWKTHLCQHGVEDDDVVPVTNNTPDNLHTLIEATSLIEHAIANDFHRIIIMAAPFHQLRAFMTTVTAAQRVNATNIGIYNQPGSPQLWDDMVRHSQGTLEQKRSELIYSELERINKYQSIGDLTTFEKTVEYLNSRLF